MLRAETNYLVLVLFAVVVVNGSHHGLKPRYNNTPSSDDVVTPDDFTATFAVPATAAAAVACLDGNSLLLGL